MYATRFVSLDRPAVTAEILDRTLHQDAFEALAYLPSGWVDLLFADPPYNLTKMFDQRRFARRSQDEYAAWLDSWISMLPRLLKPTASIYVCGDWHSAAALQSVLEKYFIVRNRITWEREKGRGALHNWKNCAEDIWFCTLSDDYVFHADAVKLKRRVRAPYTDAAGAPRDWKETAAGRFRLTYPSNLWTDITVPFWSMPENTSHPTQKPEKLLAKIVLASSNEGDVVFDPFLGSGTTSVVAKKLRRHYVGVEVNATYCGFAEKRLALADIDSRIQGYSAGCFWERNSLSAQQSVRDGDAGEFAQISE